VVALLDRAEQTSGQIYNIGSSQEVTINQLAQTVIARAASSSSIQYIPYSEAYAPGFEDMERRVPDISKIQHAIGWTPSHDLNAILDDVVDYERARLE
jgi:UDP-glucose 4-epimerase